MAIQPIDIQMMFSNLEKVGRDMSMQKSIADIQKPLEAEREARRKAEEVRSVNAAERDEAADNSNKELSRLKDGGGKNGGGAQHKNNGGRESAARARQDSFLNDPMIGHNLDLEG